jgi:uncharacterized membrane protein
MLADVLTGYAIWAPGSVVIKALAAVLFSCKTEKIVSVRNTLTLIPAALICAGGYYLYEALIYRNYVTPLSGIPVSVTQSAASSIVFVVAGLTIDKMNIKSKINGGDHQ